VVNCSHKPSTYAITHAAPAAVATRFYSAEMSDAEFDSKWKAYFDDNTLSQREVSVQDAPHLPLCHMCMCVYLV